jgi:hypothetical protein
MRKNINLPMELVNKILIMRPVHPVSLIIKQVFDNFNKMEEELNKMYLHQPREFSWSEYTQSFPIYNMYFGTDYAVNSYIHSWFFNTPYKTNKWGIKRLNIPPKNSSIFVNDIYQPLDFSLFPSDCEITNSTYSNTY